MIDNVYIRQILRCHSCPLAAVRRNVVLGRGALERHKLLLMGEAPGRSEDTLGQAFIGTAGKLLDYMLEQAGIPIADCYFTNTVLCHPSDRLGGENREPERNEVVACMENVMYIAQLVNPMAVVLVGEIAQRYYKRHFPLHWHITHPASIARTGGRSSPHILRNINILIEVRRHIWP